MHTNHLLDYAPKPTCEPPPFRYVTAYTPLYADAAAKLQGVLGERLTAYAYEDRGSWLCNVTIKPDAILRALDEQPLAVCWLDADDIPRGNLHVHPPECDVAYATAARPSPYIYDFTTRTVVANLAGTPTPKGGVLYFANRNAVRGLLHTWSDLLLENAGKTNCEQALREALSRYPALRCGRLDLRCAHGELGYNAADKPARGGVYMELRDVPDFFSELPSMPEHVYICGSGPSLRESLAKLPADAYTLACNGAINCGHTFDWYFAYDRHLTEYAWWKSLRVNHRTRVAFGDELMGELLRHPELPHPRVDYCFRTKPTISPTVAIDAYLKSGSLRRGLNIVASAMQGAFFAGARHITLLACEQYGPDHYDGSVNPDPMRAHQGVWFSAERMGRLCEALRRQDCRVEHMGRTAIPGIEVLQ